MKPFDVTAIGELNADLVLSGLQSLPEAGREISVPNCSLTLGSSTAICAAGIARLGLRTAFLGKMGDDLFGETIWRELEKYGIDLSHVRMEPSLQTGLTVSLSTSRDRALVTYMGSIDSLHPADADPAVLDYTRHIHVGSYFLQKNLRSGLPALFSTAHTKGVTTSLDAGWDDTEQWDSGIRETLRQTDLFFPNEEEAMRITGKHDTGEAAMELSKWCGTAVVKLGSHGATAARRGETFHCEAFRGLKVADTTGAGDSFNAGFLYAFLGGKDLMECLRFGNACGALSVTRQGGASSCASLQEVECLIRKHTVAK